MYIIIFGGEYIIPEPDPSLAWYNGMIFPGRLYNWDGTPLYEARLATYGYSVHYTIVFNVFVFL